MGWLLRNTASGTIQSYRSVSRCEMKSPWPRVFIGMPDWERWGNRAGGGTSGNTPAIATRGSYRGCLAFVLPASQLVDPAPGMMNTGDCVCIVKAAQVLNTLAECFYGNCDNPW